jgi:hypothetical protein
LANHPSSPNPGVFATLSSLSFFVHRAATLSKSYFIFICRYSITQTTLQIFAEKVEQDKNPNPLLPLLPYLTPALPYSNVSPSKANANFRRFEPDFPPPLYTEAQFHRIFRFLIRKNVIPTPPISKKYPNILAVGTVGVDFISVIEKFPQPDEKIRVQKTIKGEEGKKKKKKTLLSFR